MRGYKKRADGSTTLEAEYLPISPHISGPRSGAHGSCIPTSAREDTYAAVFSRIQPYSLCSYPSSSRGALNTLDNTAPRPEVGVFSTLARQRLTLTELEIARDDAR